jgi:hypothetical protein
VADNTVVHGFFPLAVSGLIVCSTERTFVFDHPIGRSAEHTTRIALFFDAR